jgi:hypothetical protein
MLRHKTVQDSNRSGLLFATATRHLVHKKVHVSVISSFLTLNSECLEKSGIDTKIRKQDSIHRNHAKCRQ